MGRSRKNGTVEYEVVIPLAEYERLEHVAQDEGTAIEEIVRASLLNDDNKERLVPRARKLIRHATITVKPEGGLPNRAGLPSNDGLD